MGIIFDFYCRASHIDLFQERDVFWRSLQGAQPLLSTLVKELVELFIRVYKSCQKRKDRYCRFQLEWHRQCSLLLRDRVDHEEKDILPLHQRWLGYCESTGAVKDVYNPVMTAIYLIT